AHASSAKTAPPCVFSSVSIVDGTRDTHLRKDISAMVQYPTANLFSFTDESGSTQLTYYPHAPGPLIAGQPSGGPRLEYQGLEGSFVFPDATSPGREHPNVQQESPLGPLVSV